MSDYAGDEEEWFADEDMWFVDDVENLPDVLVSTAYGHEPPFDPEGYDAYDSDLDDHIFYTDGDDDYFDGPPGSPSPPSSPLPRHLTPLRSNLLTPPTPTTTTNSPTPPPSMVSEHLSKIELLYKEAMIGKKFYGEAQDGDERYLKIRMRRHLVGTKGLDGVRKRRKVSHPSEVVRATPLGGSVDRRGGNVTVVEIGGDDDASEGEGDNDDGSAEGYSSDRVDGDDEGFERRRSLRGEVEIRPSGKPVGGGGVGRSNGVTGRRRLTINGIKSPPQAGEKPLMSEIVVGEMGVRKRKSTPLRD